MKFFKYTIISLFVALILNATLTAFAADYPAPPTMSTGVKQISVGGGFWTRYLTKNTWTIQKYYNYYTATVLTVPCPNCKIAAKPRDIDNDVYSSIVTQMGETDSFNRPTHINSPDIYQLYISRYDFTLLTTDHAGIWIINE